MKKKLTSEEINENTIRESIVKPIEDNYKHMFEDMKLQNGPHLYASHLRAFLGEDQYVTVVVDEKKKLINIVVSGCKDKADALERILISDEELQDAAKNVYGIKDYKLVVNGKRKTFKQVITRTDICVALAGNKYFKGIEDHDIPVPGSDEKLPMTFGMLKPEPCQAPCDDISNPYGLEHFMARDFLKFVFNHETRDIVAWATDRK